MLTSFYEQNEPDMMDGAGPSACAEWMQSLFRRSVHFRTEWTEAGKW